MKTSSQSDKKQRIKRYRKQFLFLRDGFIALFKWSFVGLAVLKLLPLTWFSLTDKKIASVYWGYEGAPQHFGATSRFGKYTDITYTSKKLHVAYEYEAAGKTYHVNDEVGTMNGIFLTIAGKIKNEVQSIYVSKLLLSSSRTRVQMQADMFWVFAGLILGVLLSYLEKWLQKREKTLTKKIIW
jgi:hypothetical protein